MSRARREDVPADTASPPGPTGRGPMAWAALGATLAALAAVLGGMRAEGAVGTIAGVLAGAGALSAGLAALRLFANRRVAAPPTVAVLEADQPESDALETAEKRLASAVEAMVSAIELYDGRDRLVLHNARFVHIYASAAEEIAKGAGYGDILRAAVEAGTIEQAIPDPESWLARDIARHRAGDSERSERKIGDMWLQVRSHRLPDGGRLVIHNDVTALHDTAERAEAQSQLLMATFNAMVQAIIVLDPDLRMRACNNRLIELFDLPPELTTPGTPMEAIARHNIRRGWVDIPGDDLEDKVARRTALYAARRHHREELTAEDGLTIEIQIQPDDAGGLVVIYTDISERREAERSLLKAKEEAEIANHAKSQFLASMTHELRTPLNAIIGFAEVLREELYGPLGAKQYGDFANDIHQGGQHLLSMINDILDLSKIEAGRRDLAYEDVDLSALVESVVRMVRQRAAEAGVRLERDLPDNLPPLHAEDKAVRQMLINLLSNAIKFTPKGGHIRVGAAYDGDGDGTLRLTVEDTGIGMSPADIPIALAPFRQIDSAHARRYQGTGLGLPLVESLIELHGGTLAIESALGEGTNITLIFPAERVRAIGHGPDESGTSVPTRPRPADTPSKQDRERS